MLESKKGDNREVNKKVFSGVLILSGVFFILMLFLLLMIIGLMELSVLFK